MKNAVKKALSIMLVAVMLFGTAPLNGFVGLELPDWLNFGKLFAFETNAATYSGKCGDSLEWTFDQSTGMLDINGVGAMDDFNFDSKAPWYDERLGIKTVTIEDGVTTIGNCAFLDCSNLTYVDIENDVIHIGRDAFHNTGIYNEELNWKNGVLYISDFLISVQNSIVGKYTIREGTRAIADSAFSSCESITEIMIPNGVVDIGNHAFEMCLYLKNVTIPDGVKTIGDYAFSYCCSLESIAIPNSVEYLGESVFNMCGSLADITIGTEVTHIGAQCFSSTAFYDDEKNWENGVLYINDYLIGADNAISNVYSVKEGTKVVAENAFSGNSKLRDITIPESVVSIGDDAFHNVQYLEKIIVDDNNTTYSSNEYGMLFDKEKTNLLQVPVANAITHYTIPDSVTDINEYAFYSCKNIRSVVIPSGVTEIKESTFGKCASLENIEIPNSIITIGEGSFYSCDLSSVTIPDSVTTISSRAFQSCSNLTNVSIGENVADISDYAFSDCTKLKKFVVNSENKSYSSDENGVLFNKDKTVLVNYPIGISSSNYIIPDGVIKIGCHAFGHCNSLTSITIPDSVRTIGDSAFSSCSNLTDVDLSYGLLTIEDSAFVFCDRLDTIELPDSITTMGNNVFCECKALKNIEMPNKITTIENGMFYGCVALESVVIPKGVTTIGDFAFSFCSNLENIELPDSVITIESRAFQACSNLKNISLPTGVTTMGEGVFVSCESLENIVIPDSVTSIEGAMFYGCKELAVINIPDSVKSIGQWAFKGCIQLSDVYYEGSEEEWSAIDIHADQNYNLLNATIHYGKESSTPKSITVTVDISTAIDGSSIWSKCFGITISSDDENAPLPENTYSIVDYYGIVTFPIEFTEEDLQGSSSKTFKYILTISSADGKKYDFIPETHQVEITINNTNGELSQEGVADCYNFNGYSYKTFEFGLIWDDGNDCCSVRPDSLSLNLVSGRTGEKIPFTISMDSRWSAELSVREVTDDFWYHNYSVEGLEHLEDIGYSIYLRESDDGYCVDAVASLSYCTVGFYTENGSSPETQYVVKNSSVAEPKAPVSQYYNFIGWYKDKDCTAGKEWNFETDTVTRNTTLYAKWEPKPVKITLKTEYGTLQEGENIKELTITIPAFSAIGIKLSEELYDSNYNHIGWVDEDGNVITATTELCEDTTLYAVWQKKPYSNATVRIKNNPGSKTINYGESIKLTATVTNKPDNARIYWYVDGDFMGMGEVFEFGFSGGTKIITVKLVDSNENVLKDVNGNEISDSENVTVKAGFFQKLISFFKNLFGINRTIVQTIMRDSF